MIKTKYNFLLEIGVKSKRKMAYMCNGLDCCLNHQFAKFNYIVKRYLIFFKVKITSFKTIRNHGGREKRTKSMRRSKLASS